MGCTVHFLPISLLYRAFVDRWDLGVVLGLLVVYLMHQVCNVSFEADEWAVPRHRYIYILNFARSRAASDGCAYAPEHGDC